MLYSSVTAERKREILRLRLKESQPLILLGAYNALTAMMIQRRGGEGVYVSGHMMAADLGLPDLGLTSITEVASRSGHMAGMVDIPTIVDADTGFGEPLNLARTIQTLENSGLSACHIEDQVNPKECGHSEGIRVVDRVTAVRRVSAAVNARRDSQFVVIARTDARAAVSLEEAIVRGKSYRDAGADVIFAEALRSPAEYERFKAEVDAPLMVNLNEFASSTPLTRDQLADLGIDIAVYPMSVMRLAMRAAEAGISKILLEGTQAGLLDQMQTRDELYDYLGYSEYQAFDNQIFEDGA